MNADASPGIAADVSVGAEVNFLTWLAIGLLVAGAILLLGGAGLIYLGARHAAAPAAAVAAPVAVTGELQPDVSRWMWLLKWFLAIPHYIVLTFLWIAFSILTLVAAFRHPLHGALPARDLRVQRRCPALDVARLVLLLLGERHGSLPPVHAGRGARLPSPPRGRLSRATEPLAPPREVAPRHSAPDPRRPLRGRVGLGRRRGLGRLGLRRPRRDPRPDRLRDPALHGPLPAGALQLRARARPLGSPRRRLRRPHDRRLPALPARHGAARARPARGDCCCRSLS